MNEPQRPYFDAPFCGTKQVRVEPSKLLWLIPTEKVIDFWTVEKPFRFYLDDKFRKKYGIDFVEVLAKDEDGNQKQTDLASTPLGVRNFFPKDGPWTRSAVMHDQLYEDLKKGKNRRYPFTRAECDILFLQGMKCDYVPLLKRQIIYRAVRLGGGIHMMLTK